MELRSLPLSARYQQTIANVYLLLIFAGLFSLVGLIVETFFPIRVVFTWLYLQPNAALCFILLGASLYLVRNNEVSRSATFAITICAIFIFLIGALAFFEFFYQYHFHLSKLLFHKETPNELFLYTTSMSLSSACNFMMAAIAIMILAYSQKPKHLVAILAFLIFSISMLSIFGYSYRIESDVHLIDHTRMRFLTSLLFIALSVALPLIQPTKLISIIAGNTTAGKSARLTMIYIILIPLIISYIENLGEVYHLYDADFGDSLLSTASLMFLMIIVAINAKIIHDEEEKKELTEEALEYVTYNDKATGLLNRYGFQEALINLLATSKSHLIAVFKLDLNQADLINHMAGIEAGNLLLKQLAERYRAAPFLKGAIMGCIGPHKFGFIVDQADRINQITDIANRLLELTSQTSIISGNNILLSSSVGVSVYPDDGKTAESLLLNSDAALNAAKKYSGNSFQFCTSKLSSALVERLEIENALQFAISENQLRLYFQPQMDIKTEKLCGAETLLRWQHPKKGIIMPSAFITIAEETGLIVSIGEWIFKEACRQIKQGWPYVNDLDDDTIIPLAINLSAAQFDERYPLVTVFQNILNEFKVNPAAIEIEITESLFMLDTQANLKRLNDFKKMGFKLAIDDFGTGYSSFNYINRIPNDKIKIDKAFIDNIPANTADAELVRAIIVMFHQLGKKVIAEGVETAEQFEFLREAGCDSLQGNYYSPAISLEEFKRFVNKLD